MFSPALSSRLLCTSPGVFAWPCALRPAAHADLEGRDGEAQTQPNSLWPIIVAPASPQASSHALYHSFIPAPTVAHSSRPAALPTSAPLRSPRSAPQRHAGVRHFATLWPPPPQLPTAALSPINPIDSLCPIPIPPGLSAVVAVVSKLCHIDLLEAVDQFFFLARLRATPSASSPGRRFFGAWFVSQPAVAQRATDRKALELGGRRRLPPTWFRLER